MPSDPTSSTPSKPPSPPKRLTPRLAAFKEKFEREVAEVAAKSRATRNLIAPPKP